MFEADARSEATRQEATRLQHCIDDLREQARVRMARVEWGLESNEVATCNCVNIL